MDLVTIKHITPFFLDPQLLKEVGNLDTKNFHWSIHFRQIALR
ncbi:hypothetical protein VB735_03100 [Halotia wernerae UHCC 0503]|nr:hypothetical protein [Halotia wernerae UHCC 0503]